MRIIAMASQILKFVKFEASCLADFLRKEFARRSAKHGVVGLYIFLRKSTKAVWYFAVGAILMVLSGLNLEFIVQLLFGKSNDGAVQRWLAKAAGKGGFQEWIAELIQKSVDKYAVPLATKASSVSGKLLIMLAITSFVIALMSSIIAFGIYKRRKWADYMVIAASFIYVPWEIYALIVSPGIATAVALFANAFIACYIIRKKRLFGGYFSFRRNRASRLQSLRQT